MNNKKIIWTVILSSLAVIYALLRFWHLTDSCLWFDELFGVHAASFEWREMLWFAAQDLIHPPLFYILLKLWIALGGETLFWLRLFPVVFSTLALFAFYQFCKQLKLSYPAIAIAFVFFACNGALIKYAQEVRMYSLVMFLATLSMWLFTRFLHLGKNIRLLTICNILLVYTHYFGSFVVVSEIAIILILQRIKIRQILIMFGICLLSFAPWIFAIFRAAQINSDLSQNIGWIQKPNLYIIVQFILDLVEPFYFQASNADFASNYLICIPILLIIGAAKILYLVNYKERSETEKVNFWMLTIFILTPVLLSIILSWTFPVSIFGTRHLIIVFAPVAIFTGLFFDKIKPFILKTVLLSILFFLFALAFVFELKRPKQTFIWCAWENLATGIPNNQPTKIFVFEDLVAYHFWFAERNNPNVEIIKIDNLEGVLEDKSYFLPRGFSGVKKLNFEEISEPKFYIAFRDKNFDLQKLPLKNLIEKGYKIGEPNIFEAQVSKAFLVEITKGN
ncbi:MAG: hypothetical protein ABIP06_12645 [Pyrinomonadaceae bacterium]